MKPRTFRTSLARRSAGVLLFCLFTAFVLESTPQTLLLAAPQASARSGGESALVGATTSLASLPADDPLRHLLSPADGWTAFRPSADSRIIFVSSSRGKDSNDGLSPASPLASIARGFQMLRNDHSDWLLLRRGDAWYEPIGSITSSQLKNGRSLVEPTLIASYGSTGPRPLLMLGDHRAGLRIALNRPASARNLAVVGIHFYDHKGDPGSVDFEPDRDKGGAGIDWKSPGEGLLIEDCRFDYLTAGVIVGKSPWKGTPDDVLRNVRIRRCVATNAWSSHGHCQGFFVNAVTGLLLEGNVLDHNGYCYQTGDVPTWFNHNVYITIRCDKVVARGNIVARGSTTGLFCRTNGILENNLCLDNCPSLNLGRITPPRPGGVSGRISGNVVIGAGVRDTPQKTELTGPGIELANINHDGAVVENNILIGDPTSGTAALQVGGAGVGAHNVIVRNNIVYNWAPAFRCFATAGKTLDRGSVSGLSLQENLFCGTSHYDGELIEQMRGPTGMTREGNICWMPPAADAVSKSKEQPPRFVDPLRTDATYHASLDREGTRQAFLREAANQSKSHWRAEYTAEAVIDYIRQGFSPTTEADTSLPGKEK